MSMMQRFTLNPAYETALRTGWGGGCMLRLRTPKNYLLFKLRLEIYCGIKTFFLL